jgi:hypothetical protein
MKKQITHATYIGDIDVENSLGEVADIGQGSWRFYPRGAGGKCYIFHFLDLSFH